MFVCVRHASKLQCWSRQRQFEGGAGDIVNNPASIQSIQRSTKGLLQTKNSSSDSTTFSISFMIILKVSYFEQFMNNVWTGGPTELLFVCSIGPWTHSCIEHGQLLSIDVDSLLEVMKTHRNSLNLFEMALNMTYPRPECAHIGEVRREYRGWFENRPQSLSILGTEALRMQRIDRPH